MPQSSLMTWLNKPTTAKDSLPDRPSPGIDRLGPQATEEVSKQSKSSTQVATDSAASFGSTLTPLPPQVELRPCGKDDIAQLKRLTSLLLPIPYPDKFYREITEDHVTSDITTLAVWHDDPSTKGRENGRLIGAIRCRLLASPPTSGQSRQKDGSPMLYLSTLVLLSPYRSHGIATHMLHMLTKRAVENYGVSSVGAHVWEANTDGLDWYRKRGFREVAREEDYYRRLDPSRAVVVQRDVAVMDLINR